MAERMSPEIAARREELLNSIAGSAARAPRAAAYSEIIRLDTRLQAFDPLTDDLGIDAYDIEGQRETWTDAIRLQDSGVQPAEFTSITAPVVMLHGDHDPHDGPLIRDSLAPVIRDLTYIEFPQCGHIPWIEKRAHDAFYRELRSQLRDALAS
jgi:pimeloyl-ACP methyl ester carboxylesterase